MPKKIQKLVEQGIWKANGDVNQQHIAMHAIIKNLTNAKLTSDMPAPKAGNSPKKRCSKSELAWKYMNALNETSITKAGTTFHWCNGTGKDGMHHPPMWIGHAANTCRGEKKGRRAMEHTQAKPIQSPKGDKPQLQPNKKLQAALLALDKTLTSGADSSDDDDEKHF